MSWIPRSLWVSFNSGSSTIPWKPNPFIQQRLLWAAADALLSGDAALWHLLSRWRRRQRISRTATSHGHSFRTGSKSWGSLPRLTGAPWDCPQHWQGGGHGRDLCRQGLGAAQRTINNDNISEDNNQFLGNTAQEGKHSRKITAEPLTPCFFSKTRLDDTFPCETTSQQVFTTFIFWCEGCC